MSNKFFNISWRNALKKLSDAYEIELEPLKNNIQNKSLKKAKQNSEWFNHFAVIYVLYLDIYRDLESCLENANNPQKKILLMKIVENVLYRILELKRDLIALNTNTNAVKSDFINLDSILKENKIRYDQLNIPVPRYFITVVDEKMKKREELLENLRKAMNIKIENKEKIVFKYPMEKSVQEAIGFIVNYERGRQGIQKGLIKKEQLLEIFRKQQKQKKLTQKKNENGKEEKNETEEAILVIQKFIRGYKAREVVDKIRKEELLFLNIQHNNNKLNELSDKIHGIEKIRKEELMEKQRELREEYEKLRRDMEENEGLEIREREMEKRRQFVIDIFEEKEGKELPPNIKDFYKKDEEKVEKTKEKDKKGKDKKPAKPKKMTEQEKFVKEREEKGPGSSPALKEIQRLIEEFSNKWSDESDFSENKLNIDYIAGEVYPEVKKKIENEVDNIMQIELDNLHIKMGINKKKEPSNKGGAKIKQPKIPGENLVTDKNPENYLPILLETGILKLDKGVSFDEFFATENVVRQSQEKLAESQPDPGLLQLKRLIIEQVVIPFGTGFNIEGMNRTYLFYGPMGSGKSLMIKAIKKATNALLFDLSADIVAEKYLDKVSISKMMYQVFKAAKEFQPAIILIDGVEHYFPKKNLKKNKHLVGKCAKFKKDLLNHINKHLSLEDKVIVIGCTSNPGLVNTPDLKKVFYKKYYFPFPDYSSRLLIINKLLEKYGIDSNSGFPADLLAFHTEGYTALSFEQLFEEVLTQARIKRLSVNKLELEELLISLSKTVYCSAEEYEAFKSFTHVVTGIKDRQSKQNENKNSKPKKR